MDPADSRRITRVPRYSGCRYASPCFVYGAVTRYGPTFQTVPLARLLQPRGPTTPDGPEPDWFGLCPGRSPLLGVSLLFSLPPATKMFQFAGFASAICRWPVFNRPGCPIRKSADQWPFAPTRGLSQLVTSFIACESLGIHRMPFLSFAITAPGTARAHRHGASGSSVDSTLCSLLLLVCSMSNIAV